MWKGRNLFEMAGGLFPVFASASSNGARRRMAESSLATKRHGPINETKFFYRISCRLRMKRRGNGIDEIGFSAVLLCLAVFLISNTGLAAADSGRKSIAEEDLHKPGEILVKFNPDVSKEARNALHERIGATVVREFKSIGVQQLQLRKGLSIREALLLYRAAPVIEYAESVGIVRTQEGMEGPQNPGVMENR